MTKRPAQRCKYSSHGLESLRPREPDKLGWVTTPVGHDLVTVYWDGKKYSNRYHHSFIERLDPVAQDAAPPPQRPAEIYTRDLKAGHLALEAMRPGHVLPLHLTGMTRSGVLGYSHRNKPKRWIVRKLADGQHVWRTH